MQFNLRNNHEIKSKMIIFHKTIIFPMNQMIYCKYNLINKTQIKICIACFLLQLKFLYEQIQGHWETITNNRERRILEQSASESQFLSKLYMGK